MFPVSYSLIWLSATSRCSIVVSIPACHADDPGSIPGNGVFPPFIFSLCVAPLKSHIYIRLKFVLPAISSSASLPLLSLSLSHFLSHTDTHYTVTGSRSNAEGKRGEVRRPGDHVNWQALYWSLGEEVLELL